MSAAGYPAHEARSFVVLSRRVLAVALGLIAWLTVLPGELKAGELNPSPKSESGDLIELQLRALKGAVAAIEKLSGDNDDQNVGIQILKRAVEEPLRQIVANAGGDASVVLNAVAEGNGNYGYNAATGEYGDMIEEGILDPTKVTRHALQNAASVSGLLLTTEAMVAEAPKEEVAPAMPDMGGMGGMGGMM